MGWTGSQRPLLPSPAAARRRCLAWLVGLAGLGPLPAVAAEPHLRVMVNEVAPYSWRDGAELAGLHPGLLRALAAEAGLQFDFSAGLYARASRALADGVADLVVTLATPDQDAQGQRVAVLHPVRYLVISRADAPLTEPAQLRGKLLGIARNAYYNALINDDETIRKFTIVDPNQGLRMLVLGRLDAVISTDLLLMHALRQPGLERAAFAPPISVGGSGYALFARRDLPEPTVQRLRAGWAALQRRGVPAALLREYGGADVAP